METDQTSILTKLQSDWIDNDKRPGISIYESKSGQVTSTVYDSCGYILLQVTGISKKDSLKLLRSEIATRMNIYSSILIDIFNLI